MKAKYFAISMEPQNDPLAPPKQLYLLIILGNEIDGGILTIETTYKKDTFDASFSFTTIWSMFDLFLTFNQCTIKENTVMGKQSLPSRKKFRRYRNLMTLV